MVGFHQLHVSQGPFYQVFYEPLCPPLPAGLIVSCYTPASHGPKNFPSCHGVGQLLVETGQASDD